MIKGNHTVTYVTTSVEETRALGEAIGHYMVSMEGPLCIALVGDLGSGKTHMAQGIGQGFGIAEEMTSPTFAIMNTYTVGHQHLYHFDVYRLEDESELDAIGFYEYTEDEKSIVEWADKFEDDMPDETLWLYFDKTDEHRRTITATSDVIDTDEFVKIGGDYVVRD